MSNLYELMGDYAELSAAADGEHEDEDALLGALDRLDAAKGTLRDKVDAVCKVLSNLNSEIEGYKDEEERLSKHRKTLENNKERLRGWVRQSMDVLDVREIKTDVHKVRIQSGPEQVVVVDEDRIPPEFWRIKREPDKMKAMKSYKEDGLIVDGFDVVPGSPRLVIR